MSDFFLGQTLAEKYRIDEAQRASGLGKIYRGNHLLMDKPVTVKLLPPALAIDESIVKRFSEEARAVSHISHPNVLNVTDFGSDKDAVYIIFESVEGETLKEAILREGKFSLETAVDIARQIAAGLSAAHRKGFVHGHLKSENILLVKTEDESEMVKILEFGSVKDDREPSLKELEYLAPEQNSSVQETDERSDIYSLGVILYEMLAGEAPFAAENATALMLKHAEEPPAPLTAFRTDLPAGIEPVVLKALAKDPETRYQTAHEFSDDLQAAFNSKAFAAKASGNIWKTFAIVLIGIIALSGLLIYALSTKQRNPDTMQTDAGAQPVQPINPATGLSEQSLSNMAPMSTEMLMNSNMSVPGTLPGGDGYNPWANPGQFQQIPPGGQTITIDPGNSQFMPPDGSVILVPQTPTPKPSPSETKPAANTQSTPATTDTPVNTAKPTTSPKTTPAKKPAKTPSQSDKKQDTD